MLHTIETYIILFFIYAITGWIMEVTCKLIEKKKFINRGFLIGPYCPIYGYGAILITILLKKYIDDPIALFIMGIVICSLLEYFTSYFMEKLFNARWWDYSQRKFNLNGRICLNTTIPFGLLGLFIMYISNPFLFGLIEKIPANALDIICVILLIIFATDNIISFNIISHINVTSEKLKDNTEEITEKVKSIFENKSILHRRLIHAFPNMKMRLKNKIKNNKK